LPYLRCTPNCSWGRILTYDWGTQQSHKSRSFPRTRSETRCSACHFHKSRFETKHLASGFQRPLHLSLRSILDQPFVSQFFCNSPKQAQLYSFKFAVFATIKKQLSRSFGGLAWWQTGGRSTVTTSQSCLPLKCFPTKVACCYESTTAYRRPEMWYLCTAIVGYLACRKKCPWQDDVTHGVANGKPYSWLSHIV
jgi:hypothetical protein